MPAPGLLVPPEWLHAHLDDPALRVVDIRGHVISPAEPPPHYFNHRDDYLRFHIPGAVFVDWVREITDPADPRHAQIAPPDRFAACMSAHGIGDEVTVIAYDDFGGIFAARLWWALNYYGHADVAVLDGGWPRWIAENRPVTDLVSRPAPAIFTPRIQPGWRKTAGEVQAALGPAQMLVDVRTPDEFAGITSRARRFGHIPTAINIPRNSLIQPDGTLPGLTDLRERFAPAHPGQPAEVVFYCSGGVSASYGLLAWRAAGLPGGSVYDGSWKEWGNDDLRPIEQ
jgi:thiosulfate/3-mercaptopyruvate sulfurtransferase